MTMQTVGQALHAAFSDRAWSPEERQAIEDVLDAAAEWRAGKLPLKVANEVGEIAGPEGIIASAQRVQCAAVLAAHPSDPRRADLRAMLDALVARQPGVVLTHQGVMTEEALYAQRLDPRSLPFRERRAPWEEAAA